VDYPRAYQIDALSHTRNKGAETVAVSLLTEQVQHTDQPFHTLFSDVAAAGQIAVPMTCKAAGLIFIAGKVRQFYNFQEAAAFQSILDL